MKKYFILITTYLNGVCKNIEKKYPLDEAKADEMLAKLKAEPSLNPNETVKFEKVVRF